MSYYVIYLVNIIFLDRIVYLKNESYFTISSVYFEWVYNLRNSQECKTRSEMGMKAIFFQGGRSLSFFIV